MLIPDSGSDRYLMMNLQNIIGVTMRMKDEQEKLAARKELSTGKLPEILEALEKILIQNGSTGELLYYLDHSLNPAC